ncbi:hypothetical protein P7C70_g5627, partial [Phenoliferia sp. Uapishka_3]
MATIHSLAPELIDAILKNLVSREPYIWKSASPRTGPFGVPIEPPDLLATSLVCKAFRYPSQELLSQYLDFTHAAHMMRGMDDGQYDRYPHRAISMEKWLAGAPPCDRVKRLWVIDTFVREVLDRLSDVRELGIIGRVEGPWEWGRGIEVAICPMTGDCNQAGWELLHHPTLKNLKSLSIQASGRARKRAHSIPTLKFSLEHLALRTPGNPPPELLDALFTPTCSSKLQSLSLFLMEPGNYPQWSPPTFPDLHHLTQLNISLSYALTASISTLLGCCTSLIELTLRNFLMLKSERLFSIGLALPSRATITTLRLVAGEHSPMMIDKLEELNTDLERLLTLPAMSKLRWVCVPAVDVQQEWKQGMDVATFLWALLEGDQSLERWKKHWWRFYIDADDNY